jgi:hypothetical protein
MNSTEATSVDETIRPRPNSDPATRARMRAATADERAGELDTRLGANSRLRVGGFLLLVVPLLLLETSPGTWRPWLLGSAAVGALVFALLVRRHRRIRRLRDRERLRGRLHRESLARMAREWDDAPIPRLGPAPDGHPCAVDLNLLGRASLAHLLGRVNTGPGRSALRRALLDPLHPPADELDPPTHRGAPGRTTPWPDASGGWLDALSRRQAAVQALASRPDLMEELELATREIEGTAQEARTSTFLDWATSGTWLSSRPGFLWAARGFVGVNVVTLTLWLIGTLPPFWILSVLGTYLVNRAAAVEAHQRFSAAEGGEGDPLRWARLLEVARGLPDDDPTLARIAEVARTPAPGAGGALKELQRITDLAAIRYSGLVHFPLVALTAWDVHILARLERWQERYGKATERWVGAVAELEYLLALAGMAAEHPDWCFATIRPEGDGGIKGRGLGHPLLPPDRCVGNDVEVPSPGRLLLVTGSNMAGKTTLLRALGANQILALMGAPVAAREFETAPLLPWTAMRVQDSVNEGVSFFMAELKRLRRVVDGARTSPTLFLLDEILQGTNTAERRTAARIVLNHLLATDSVGAVTTHDLTLADAPELHERSDEIHFREEVVVEEDGRRALEFDYRLRPGPATSRNALLLLEIVGLGPDLDGGDDERMAPEDAEGS